jgi:eukaryotic-like serine/threonine-protein kinase
MTEPQAFGRYELLRRLAAGRMAELFVARQRSVSGFEKQLVIKRILANRARDPDFVRMFLDEARVAATLDHPNIVQIYDVGHVEDEYFIAMEHIPGKNLVEILRAGYRQGQAALPLAQAIGIASSVCSGLHFAHDKRDFEGRPLGIVHRDVTPQNIMVTFDGGVKLVDFGIAKAASREVETMSGTLKGKMGYMSPEQCRGMPVDRRSDIFALGVVLYELTTGKRLYREKSEFETLKKIVDGPVPSPREADPTLPEELDAIVVRCLQKEPDARFADARALHEALETLAQWRALATGTMALAQWMERLFPDEQVQLPPMPMDGTTGSRPISGYVGESSRRRHTTMTPIDEARRKRGWHRLLAVGAAAFVLSAAFWAWRNWPLRPTPAATTTAAAITAVPPVAEVPLEAAALDGPGDAPPQLAESAPPSPPAQALPLSPTIVCRLLVGRDGAVHKAQIFRSRLELAQYEDAALAAVQRYRFVPARKAGQPVAVWIDWPVQFAR